jgi:alkylation response protein AidB-like acyl-CoA dehydrogenase
MPTTYEKLRGMMATGLDPQTLEQPARDAKALQLYGGTDEMQITHIAEDLLRSSFPNC